MTRNLIYSDFSIEDLTDNDLGKPILYVDKYDNQIAILVGYTKEYLLAQFGDNQKPLMLKPSVFKKITML